MWVSLLLAVALVTYVLLVTAHVARQMDDWSR
jgi:hypothetical protein